MSNATFGQTRSKATVHITNEHQCCLLPRINRRIRPIALKNLNSFHQHNEQQELVKAYVFAKLEKYSMQKVVRWTPLITVNFIRRQIKNDARHLAQEYGFDSVSNEQINMWIDEIFTQINQFEPHVRTIDESIEELQQSLITGKYSATVNDSQWIKDQLERARTVLPNKSTYSDKELLSAYRNYVVETLSPPTTQRRPNMIDLDVEYEKAVEIGRQQLITVINKCRQRDRPNLNLIKEMINLGMEQMVKQPDTEELRAAATTSSFLEKVRCILRLKKAYRMSLKNLADDFMLLRFGRLLDEPNADDPIRQRFIKMIRMFLNDLTLLIASIKQDIPLSFCQWTTDLSIGNILHPSTHIDQWTWLLEKWKTTLQTIPFRLVSLGAFGRITRTTIGIGIARLYVLAENDEQLDGIDNHLFQALQIGFYYGIAYALVDGLQDDQQHTEQNTDIETWLVEMEHVLCGDQLDRSRLPRLPIASLLVETFDSLVQLTSDNAATQETFADLALLLRSQRFDKKNINVSNYDDVDLYIGPLMKAHFTYTITGLLSGIRTIHKRERLWTMPFLGQLTDDCRDFGEDRRTRSITPFTHFAEHGNSSLNPFFVFLFVIEDIYLDSNHEPNTGAFLGRRILRTLRALQTDLPEFLDIFTAKSFPQLHIYALSLRNLFSRVSDPDKSIFRSANKLAIRYSLTNRCLETFAYDHLPLIEKNLSIQSSSQDEEIAQILARGINHSLKAGGKRLRPLLLFMVAQQFAIDIECLVPLAHALEYLHTSSLIFDDLPAQDNAPMRRGQPTLHRSINDTGDIPPSLTEGRAQLAAIDLIAQAIRLVSVDLRHEGFTDQSINRVAAELAQSMHCLCQGQFLDLCSARMANNRTVRSLSLSQLDRIAELKTGKAIEVALVCPAILAATTASDFTIDRLRQLGEMMGILFQMKDDLLDIEGDTNELGKQTKIDQENHTITYPALLGVDKTRERIMTMRKKVEKIVDELWPLAGTIQDVIRYICERRK